MGAALATSTTTPGSVSANAATGPSVIPGLLLSLSLSFMRGLAPGAYGVFGRTPFATREGALAHSPLWPGLTEQHRGLFAPSSPTEHLASLRHNTSIYLNKYAGIHARCAVKGFECASTRFDKSSTIQALKYLTSWLLLPRHPYKDDGDKRRRSIAADTIYRDSPLASMRGMFVNQRQQESASPQRNGSRGVDDAGKGILEHTTALVSPLNAAPTGRLGMTTGMAQLQPSRTGVA